MNYFQAKRNKQFLLELRDNVKTLWRFEEEASNNIDEIMYPIRPQFKKAVTNEALKNENYCKVREIIARKLPKAKRVSEELECLTTFKSYPAPAVGGPVLDIDLFDAILNDTSHGGIPNHMILDYLDRIIGTCDEKIKEKFHHLINPFYWAWSFIVFIIRIPFILISATGFNVDKIEDHFLAKLFKLIEMIVIIFLFLKLGVNKDGVLTDIILKTFQ